MPKLAIICVDDEKLILTSLQNELGSFLKKSIILEMAESGEEALEIIEEMNREGIEPAVCVTDQIMPGMKGDALLVKLHKDHPDTVKILLTGQAEVKAVGNAINHANLYRYIAKPWEKADFMLTIREAIKKYVSNALSTKQKKIINNLNAAVIEDPITNETIELSDPQYYKKVMFQHYLHNLSEKNREWFMSATLGLINVDGKITRSKMIYLSAIVSENRSQSFVESFLEKVNNGLVPDLPMLIEKNNVTHEMLRQLSQILVEVQKLTHKEFDYFLYIGGKLGMEKNAIKTIIKCAKQEIRINHEARKCYQRIEYLPQVFDSIR